MLPPIVGDRRSFAAPSLSISSILSCPHFVLRIQRTEFPALRIKTHFSTTVTCVRNEIIIRLTFRSNEDVHVARFAEFLNPIHVARMASLVNFVHFYFLLRMSTNGPKYYLTKELSTEMKEESTFQRIHLLLFAVLYQKRFKKERKIRIRIQQKLESETKRRNQIEDALRTSGAPAEALRLLSGM